MLTQVQADLVCALVDILVDGPMDTTSGICYSARALVIRRRGVYFGAAYDNAVRDEITATFKRMGIKDLTYPVAGGMAKYDEYADNNLNMWDRSDPYGAARWALLDRCIKHLTELE